MRDTKAFDAALIQAAVICALPEVGGKLRCRASALDAMVDQALQMQRDLDRLVGQIEGETKALDYEARAAWSDDERAAAWQIAIAETESAA